MLVSVYPSINNIAIFSCFTCFVMNLYHSLALRRGHLYVLWHAHLVPLLSIYVRTLDRVVVGASTVPLSTKSSGPSVSLNASTHGPAEAGDAAKDVVTETTK